MMMIIDTARRMNSVGLTEMHRGLFVFTVYIEGYGHGG